MADEADELFQSIEGGEPAPEPVAEQPQPEPQAPEPVAPGPEPVEQPKDEVRHVPLPTFLEMRDEAKEAKRERDEFKRQLEEARKAPPAALPDPYDDPEGYTATLRAELDQRLVAQRFEISDQLAREKHGDETVEAAVAWAKEKAQADPTFAAGYMQDKNPINWIVAQHKRDAEYREMSEDPVAYARKIAEREGWLSAPNPAPAPAAAVPQQAPTPPKVPRSLATQGAAPSDIRHLPAGPLVGLDAFT